MKKIQLLAVMVGVVALTAGASAATNVKPVSVTCVSIQGQARYSIDGKVWHPLVAGKILHQGAVIETAANSTCNLVLSGSPVPVPEESSAPASMAMVAQAPDPNIRGYVAMKPMAEQNVILMDPDTMLAVDKLTSIDTGADTVSDTELDLRTGGIFTNVKKMSASSQYIIKLPDGVAGIRGSRGHLGSDGRAEWVSGIIVLSVIGPDGHPHVIVVRGGYDYNPKTGQISDLSPSLLRVLARYSAQAQTIYAELVAIAINTQCRISPTQGVTTVDGGNNNNNNNNNNEGEGSISINGP